MRSCVASTDPARIEAVVLDVDVSDVGNGGAHPRFERVDRDGHRVAVPIPEVDFRDQEEVVGTEVGTPRTWR